MDWIDLQAPALDVGAVRRVRDDGSKAAGSFLTRSTGTPAGSITSGNLAGAREMMAGR